VFGALFRKKSIEELFGEAEALRRAGRLGEAKLAFDRISERALKDGSSRSEQARECAEDCCDAIALERIAEAKKLIRQGRIELARDELKHAEEIAKKPGLVAEARAIRAGLHATPTGTALVPNTEDEAAVSDEEALAVIMGTWTAAQCSELERYGEPLFAAVLARARGEVDTALRALRGLIARARCPVYLHLLLAETLLEGGNERAAEVALRDFIDNLNDGQDPESRLMAHRHLAQIRHDRGDAAGAEGELLEACEAMLDDPRPYLDLGHYLRSLGRSAEALEVLRLCEGNFPEGRAEWPVLMELGLVAAQLGDQESARTSLRGAANALLAMGVTELPPALEAALASLQGR
jgi:tetratricopeptide (TPR) repeat protein